MLICPICHTPLERKEHTWECILVLMLQNKGMSICL